VAIHNSIQDVDAALVLQTFAFSGPFASSRIAEASAIARVLLCHYTRILTATPVILLIRSACQIFTQRCQRTRTAQERFLHCGCVFVVSAVRPARFLDAAAGGLASLLERRVRLVHADTWGMLVAILLPSASSVVRLRAFRGNCSAIAVTITIIAIAISVVTIISITIVSIAIVAVVSVVAVVRYPAFRWTHCLNIGSVAVGDQFAAHARSAGVVGS